MKAIHYLQITDRESAENPLRKKCMSSVRSLVREGQDTYEVVTLPRSNQSVQDVVRSDKIRFERAANDPCLCYVDTDCFMVKPFFPPDDDCPYFPLYEFISIPEPFPEPFLFYTNGNTQFFYDCIQRGLHNEPAYSFDLAMLRGMEGYKTIPADHFVHCYISLSAVVERQRLSGYVEALELELAAFRQTTQQNALTMKLFEKLRNTHHG